VLSPREEQVLRLLSCGSSTREVAEAAKISDRTVETYPMRAMSKLALSGRADLIRFAIFRGWLEHLG
jgi:DNA-binding NarL/FixJ family response regulator